MPAMRISAVLLAAAVPAAVVGFLAPSVHTSARRLQLPAGLRMSATEDTSPSPFDRRSLVNRVAAGLLGTAAVVTTAAGTGEELRLLTGVDTVASASEPGTKQSPIAVVGAGGKTGKLAVEGLLKRGRNVRAVTRTGEFSLRGGDGGDLMTTAAGDVTKTDTLKQALAGCGAVLFCASASKKGGNAEAVDYQGVLNTAQACVELGVPRLVVISSGAVTKPDSLGFKVTNVFGNIMTLKRKGEVGLEEIYAAAPKGVTYTIVRPGGLTDGAVIGPAGIELNQGDTIGGTVGRGDVAEVVVEAALSPATENTIFEIYDKKSRGPLQGGLPKTSGYERSGESYDAIFKGLQGGIGL
ncbi:unnamed protein product [Ectocarpus sp. 13 AM-2016]